MKNVQRALFIVEGAVMICVAIAIWPGDRPKACIMLVVLGIAAWIAALAPFKE